MSRMQGKVALVSGGAEGIGGTLARMIVAEGGSVIAVTWPPQPWERWSDSLPAPQPQSV